MQLRKDERAPLVTPSPSIKSFDLRGFDSSTILILRVGIPRPIGIS